MTRHTCQAPNHLGDAARHVPCLGEWWIWSWELDDMIQSTSCPEDIKVQKTNLQILLHMIFYTICCGSIMVYLIESTCIRKSAILTIQWFWSHQPSTAMTIKGFPPDHGNPGTWHLPPLAPAPAQVSVWHQRFRLGHGQREVCPTAVIGFLWVCSDLTRYDMRNRFLKFLENQFFWLSWSWLF